MKKKTPVCFLFLLLFVLIIHGKDLKNTLNRYGLMHLNEWIAYFQYDQLGVSVYSGTLPEGGAFFPSIGGTLTYMDGLAWAGLRRDGGIRALHGGGIFYLPGLQPGWIVQSGNGGHSPQAVATFNPRVRMYRWRKDFFKVSDEELKKEVALLMMIPEDSVTQAWVDTLRQQYWQDLQEWPADLGAPYYDRNQNGRYDPDYDEPGLLGADQLIWYVVNDLNEMQPTIPSPYFEYFPIGLEIQITVWSYKMGLSSVLFSRYRIVNKSGSRVDSMFIGFFADCNIGDYEDDLVGCDSILGYGFAYNGKPVDAVFSRLNMAPPAMGVVLLQGPMVPAPGATAYLNFEKIADYKNLPMTSFW